MEPSFYIGPHAVWRIQEWEGPFAPPGDLFAEFDNKAFTAEVESFSPAYYAEGYIYAFLQSWLIDTGEHRVLVDTGAGNDKQRPGIPVFGNLATDYLEQLAQTGFSVEDIDIVVNTHLHIDHVGWNTVLESQQWRPTFPNAKYILPRVDRETWDPALDSYAQLRGKEVNTGVFEDSVQPILDAGQAVLVGPGEEILPGMVMIDTPGHTPGHMMLEVCAGEECALFTGDILHHPMQILRPDWNSVYCEDRARAVQTRQMVLERAVTKAARIVPAHFGGSHSVFIDRCGGGYRPRSLES